MIEKTIHNKYKKKIETDLKHEKKVVVHWKKVDRYQHWKKFFLYHSIIKFFFQCWIRFFSVVSNCSLKNVKKIPQKFLLKFGKINFNIQIRN
jgi:hypothetical protein